MSIPSSLLKPMYFAYPMGENSKDKAEYSEPIKIFALKEDVTSIISRNNVGIDIDYDRIILVPIGGITQFFDEQAKLWVDVEPNNEGSNEDYKVERLGDIVDGNRVVYLNSLTQNFKALYYLHQNGKIYKVKVDYDELVALVPFNKYLPITSETKVWLTKPTNENSTTNLIRLVSKEKKEKGYKLTFEKVVANDNN